MSLIIKLDAQDLQREFERCGRDNFSRYAYECILEDFEDTADVELDVVGIDCDYVEASIEQIADDYSNSLDLAELEDLDDEGEKEHELRRIVLEFLQDNTHHHELDNDNILYIAF